MKDYDNEVEINAPVSYPMHSRRNRQGGYQSFFRSGFALRTDLSMLRVIAHAAIAPLTKPACQSVPDSPRLHAFEVPDTR